MYWGREHKIHMYNIYCVDPIHHICLSRCMGSHTYVYMYESGFIGSHTYVLWVDVWDSIHVYTCMSRCMGVNMHIYQSMYMICIYSCYRVPLLWSIAMEFPTFELFSQCITVCCSVMQRVAACRSKILKHRLASPFPVYNVYIADFSEFLTWYSSSCLLSFSPV